MGDYQDPPLRFTVEGLRWMGYGFESLGTSATFTLHGTDSGDSGEILRLLRAQLSKRLRMQAIGMMLTLDQLDFDAPNAPTENDMRELEAKVRNVLEAIEALRELAPEVINDDDDDGPDDEPDPDPAPTGALGDEDEE